MHSGQRLYSGHLSNEASCKVLTSSFGRLFPPFPLFSLGCNCLSFSFYRPGPREGGWVGGWGLGAGRRGLGRDVCLALRIRLRHPGPRSACLLGPARSGPRSVPLRPAGQDDPGAPQEPPERSEGKRGLGATAGSGPGRPPSHPPRLRSAASLAPQGPLYSDFYPHPHPSDRERKRVRGEEY